MKQWKKLRWKQWKKNAGLCARCMHAVVTTPYNLHAVIPSPQIFGFFTNSLMLCPGFKLYLITFASSRSCDWELQRTLYVY